MDDTYRRSISELVTRYRFHPEFRDLFVEGDRDVSVYDWFLSRIPMSRAAVYPINSIEVTSTTCQEMGVSEGGNKGRAIALALKLDRELSLECRSVLCLVDKDFHEFNFSLPNCRYLIYTAYACLECYVLGKNPLAKLCVLYLGKTLTETEIDSTMEILTYIFSVRLAKRRLAPNTGWFEDFTRCCSIRNECIHLDRSAYLRSVLNFAAGALTAEAIETEVRRFATLVIGDRRQAMHGHDIIRLISWIAHQKGVPREIANAGPLRRAMLGLLEIEDLQREPLFARIAEWACEAT
jgi:hypothetical protein